MKERIDLTAAGNEGSGTYRTAVRLMQRLEEAGYEAYLVGGAVRDIFTGRAEGSGDPDIDIATGALPDEIKSVFSDRRTVDTGIKHGTVTVITDGGSSAEITTFRTESGYSDGRHPDSVSFVGSIEEDLARRDFTMNAIACASDGSIKDPYGGREDILSGTIRAVGDPEKRFEEDALRIMRGIRFSSELGFSMDGRTEEAAFAEKDRLLDISKERIFGEFVRLMCGRHAADAVRRYIDIIGVFIPEMLPAKGFDQNNPYHRYDVLEHCIKTMEYVRAKDDMKVMKIAALLHDVGKPYVYTEDENGMGHFYDHAKVSGQMCDEILRRLRADKDTRERICTIVKQHSLVFKKDERLLKKWMNRFTPEVLFEILEIKRADNLATGNMSRELMEKFNDIGAMMQDILDEGKCFSLSDLAVRGEDIMEIGVPQGPEVGEILGSLLEGVIDGRLENEKKPLLEEAAVIHRRSDPDL